jgi:protease-4
MSEGQSIPLVQPVGQPRELPVARPTRGSYGPPPPTAFGSLLSWIFRTLLLVSIFFNVVFLFLYLPDTMLGTSSLTEKYHSGEASATDKVAIVRVDGSIVEGLMGYASSQLRDAARDDRVKAIVLAINSPGGSVTASDQLHKQIIDLRDGKWEKPSGSRSNAKPVVVAMESIAASGGYYIAAPAQSIFAEPTTITGSIGVYIPILDLHELADKYGVKMHIVKKGELKASGSMFKEFTPAEREEFDEQIEATYQRFMKIVKDGRGAKLKVGLREELQVPSLVTEGKTIVRRVADGGIYTPEQALQYGLIDHIGYTEDAIAEAKKLAGITSAKVITYNRPITFGESFLGISSNRPDEGLNLSRIPGMTARMWYLTPGYELTDVRVPMGPN